ncbi:MAG: gliding motility-associated C-terminal domain-containing protein [Rickettsiales bacterium]|nr:gliding motility-associated C-terminal domain-containing protein [Rickettsiales bacterium]
MVASPVNNHSNVTPGTVYDPKTGEKKATDPNKDRSTFLQLLTTQLKNQDPTSPADTNQVTQQIALLSQVEQQTKSNSYLEQLVSMFTQNSSKDAVGYIGSKVEAAGNKSDLSNGTASFEYDLPAGVDKATINVYDANSKLVYSSDKAPISSGRNKFDWNGKNAKGDEMAAGAYTFEIKAVDASKRELTATTYTTGIVQGVQNKDGVSNLSLGSFTIPTTSVLKIAGTPATQDPVNYIGRIIEAEGNKGDLSGGKASFEYDLPDDVEKATVSIYKTDGTLVYTGDGTTIAGRNKVVWDGTNASGEDMPAGTYTFTVKATGKNDAPVAATTYTTGVVKAVETQNGVSRLSLGSFTIPMNSILKVSNPPYVAAA